MQLGVLLGLLAVLGVIAAFIMHYINYAMDADDSSKIDEVPQNDFNQNT